MTFFDTYTSNTTAGSGNQNFYEPADENAIVRSRCFFRMLAGGEASYSFLFSNIVDSTFGDGARSRKNRVIGEWQIHAARVAVARESRPEAVPDAAFLPLRFDGKSEKRVHAGELFASDGLPLSVAAGDYLCLELSVSGRMLPCHPESIVPTFVLQNGAWEPSTDHPFPSMIGCDRAVSLRIAFMGDSITQGIGTEHNSYTHWNHVVATSLGPQNAYWNLGLGYGRAEDAASDGVWLYKAKQNDIVVLCYGVNDILQGFSADEVKQNLTKAVMSLKEAGVRVILQSVPPFDYTGERIAIWHEVNRYIKEELSHTADLYFDNVPILGKSEKEPELAPFGGHPNAEGCKAWGDALAAAMREYLEKSKL